VPLPVPLLPDVTVSQLVLFDIAVQLQPDEAVTETDPLPADEDGETDEGDTE